MKLSYETKAKMSLARHQYWAEKKRKDKIVKRVMKLTLLPFVVKAAKLVSRDL